MSGMIHSCKNIVSITLGLLISISLYVVSMPAQSAEVQNLYQASVLVSSRTDERERSRAFAIALQEVITKVSGIQPAVNPPSIRRALANPEPYVDSWIYRTLPAPDSLASDENSVELQVSFFQSTVQALLAENNIPIWPSNRPSTLIWLVTQDELSARQVHSSSSPTGNEVAARIERLAASKGLPILFPLMDIEDQQNINADALWGLNEEAIRRASQRYQVQSVLAVRVYRSLSGELLTRSLYMFRERAELYDSFDSDLDTFLETSVNMVIRELSAYYSVLISATGGEMVTVKMRVDGIEDVRDYAGILNYLSNLDSINSYQLSSVGQGSMELELSSSGQLRQLIEAIALDQRFEPVSDLRRNESEVSVYYRWTQ